MEVDIDAAYNNYAALTDEEKNTIRVLMDGPAKVIISKIFGEGFIGVLGSFSAPAAPTPTPTPKKRTMAPTMTQQQPQAKPQGLAARPQR